MQDPTNIRLSNLEERTKELECDAVRFEVAIAEIKVMMQEIQKDIAEIKSVLNSRKNGSQIEIKRYEYLLMLGTIILSLISFFTVVVKGGFK